MSDNDKPLSRRELLAVQGLAAGKTATTALLEAGYAPSVAEKQQKAVLGKPRVQRAILRAMEEAGISEKLLAKTMREGLEAERHVYHAGKRIAREPDHSTRRKACELVLKVRGDLEPGAGDEGETWEALVFAVRARRAQSSSSEQ